MTTVVIALCSLAIVGIVLARRLRLKRAKSRRQASITATNTTAESIFRELLVAAENGDAVARRNLFTEHFKYYSSDRSTTDHSAASVAAEIGLSERYNAVMVAHDSEQNYGYYHQVIRDLLSAWRGEAGSEDLIGLIKTGISFMNAWESLFVEHQIKLTAELKYNHAEAVANHRAVVAARYTALVALAPTFSASFYELLRYFDTTHREYRYLPKALNHPAGWNSWVAKYIEVPCFADFVGIPGYSDKHNQDWVFHSAATLHDRDVVDALVIIATCYAAPRGDIRPELSILLADLAKMVAEERGLQGWTATTEHDFDITAI